MVDTAEAMLTPRGTGASPVLPALHGRGARATVGGPKPRRRLPSVRAVFRNRALYLLLLPTFILLGVFNLIPFVLAFATSLTRYEVGTSPEFVGLQNYVDYFRDPTLLVSFRNMAFLTGFAVLVTIVVPLTAAKLIFTLSSSSPRASYFYRVLFLVPIVVPTVATQLIWGNLVLGEQGLINETLRAIGLSHWTHGWMSEPRTVLWSLAFIGFPFAGGINILVYYAGLTAIPESVHEAAVLDGATGLGKFLRIDVPLVLSQIKLLVILAIINGVQGFESILILTRGGPGFRSMVPGLWMYFNAFSFQRMGYACAIGVVLFMLIMIVTVLNLKYFRSAEEMQS